MEPIPPPPKLIRTLSEHHWQAAKSDLGENNIITAGTTYDNEGNIEWQYYIVNKGNYLEKHVVCQKHNIHETYVISNT